MCSASTNSEFLWKFQTFPNYTILLTLITSCRYLKHGILSHKEAQNYPHISVADQAVQARRARKRVPDGLPLHHYANLYINAQNPMLFIKCQEGFRNTICVIRVNKKFCC
ncbi:MAG: DUF4433 domain-containing protein [Chloroflexi bacterium]|nr:DUF4433 domain-containing protein [Chloroflexota bacterium]MDL1884397.1 DUF4433 domain-containing protein [Anaerolineae bacterium CFX8]